MSSTAEIVSRLRRVVRVLNRRAQAETGVGSPTRSQQAVLAWLDEHDTVTPTALATLEQVRPQSMSQTLDALERSALIARTGHPSDRRQVLISLTPSGKTALERGRKLRQEWLEKAVNARLSADEQRVLAAAIPLLERIVQE
jgi:DNA-binding MarR family transcriptional regulator